MSRNKKIIEQLCDKEYLNNHITDVNFAFNSDDCYATIKVYIDDKKFDAIFKTDSKEEKTNG